MTPIRDFLKQKLGTEAAAYVKDGMVVGLGTGTTSHYFIQSLAARCKDEGLRITCVASSEASEREALALGLHVIDLDADVSHLDLIVDGADEIDPAKNLIKGKGGALLREKILAQASREMIVIADHGKLVEQLGQGILPVEIEQFGSGLTLKKIESLGIQAHLRKATNGEPFITDGGNWTLDLVCPPELYKDLQKLHSDLISIPGVIETGLFLGIAGRILIADSNGIIQVR